MYTLWSFFIKKQKFSFLFIIALSVFGIGSIISIPKESTPEVEVPIGIVTTVFSGATAETIERLVTDPLEDALQNGLSEVSEITSSSQEGVSSVVVEFRADADIDASIDELRREVDRAKSELPAGAEDPSVSSVDFVDQPILTFAISGDRTPSFFTNLAETLTDELERVPGVSSVSTSGVRDREVQVIVDRAGLERFDVRLTEVISAINASNTTLPVGSIVLDGVSYSVAFEGDIRDPSEVRDIAIINKNGQPVFVRDVAFVSDGLESATTFSRVSEEGAISKPAAVFNVSKRSRGNINEITVSVRKRLEELSAEGELLEGLSTVIVLDSGELLAKDLFSLVRTGLQTTALVFLILLLTIGWREAIIAGVAIPLSFLVAFIGLSASGNTINFVSLFALILSVGILVDSAIVVVEAIHTNLKSQMEKKEAAFAAIKKYHWPLTSGTLTTIAVFVPLFLVSGVTGEFIASIPFTVISVLFASMLVALGLIPLIASIVMRRRVTGRLEIKQEKWAKKIRKWYERKIRSIIGYRRRETLFFAGIIFALLFALSLPATGVVKVIFFPQDDIEWIVANIELTEGSTLRKTDLEVRRVEELLFGNPVIESYVATVGESSQFTGTGGSVGEKFGNIFITLKDDREKTSSELLRDFREKIKDIHSAEVRFVQPNNGPPTGDPIFVRFLGDDLKELDRVANQASLLLAGVSGAVDVVLSTKDTATQFVLSVNIPKATELGLDSNVIAQILRASVQGTEATTIRATGDDIDVVVTLNLNPEYESPEETNYASVDAIRQIPIQTPNGSVLLGSVLDVTLENKNAVIRREDGSRVSSISADVSEGASVLEVTALFEERVKEAGIVPENITMVIGGETEDVDQSFRDMFVALGVGMISMLAILVLQFNSFRHALYVLSIVPFSLIGIFLGLLITNNALSFPSIMGFIALSGIVVNNSIILIDAINRKRRESNGSRPISEIVIEGAGDRLRPILLTTLTTVVGVIPLTFASQLWAPLAFALMFGLSFSVVITLVLVPVIYSRWPGTLPD